MMNFTWLTSYFAFTSSGSASRRWNMIGTMWKWVTLRSAMDFRTSSESHLSKNTRGTPAAMAARTSKFNGAAW